jgi:hypothetical protein
MDAPVTGVGGALLPAFDGPCADTLTNPAMSGHNKNA